jgi:guanylate kinase
MPSEKPHKKGWIFVISGPSGSGKTTIATRIISLKGLRNRLIRPVSYTTRPMRSGERNGKDYVFVDIKQFRSLLQAKKILEWTKYLGYYYGTPKHFVERYLDRGKHLILCLDLKGALKIKRLYPDRTIMIFITAPSLSTLKQRILSRCHKTGQKEIVRRLQLARQELATINKYDYCLVNQDLKEVISNLKSIILKKISS